MRHPASLTRNNHGTSVSAGPTLVTKRQTWCEFRQLSHEFLFSIQNGNHIHSENLTAVSGEKQSHKGQRLQVTGFKAMGTKALQQGTQRRSNEGPHAPQRKKSRKARSQLRNHYSGTSAAQTRSPRRLRPLEVAARQGCDTPTVPEAFQQEKHSPDRAWQAPHCRRGRPRLARWQRQGPADGVGSGVVTVTPKEPSPQRPCTSVSLG